MAESSLWLADRANGARSLGRVSTHGVLATPIFSPNQFGPRVKAARSVRLGYLTGYQQSESLERELGRVKFGF